MDKLDVIADQTLRKLAKEEKLRTLLRQPAYKYYLQGGIIGVIIGLCGIACIVWLLLKHSIPTWGFMGIGIAFIALIESMRSNCRIDALIQLQELIEEKSEQGVAPYVAQSAPSGER